MTKRQDSDGMSDWTLTDEKEEEITLYQGFRVLKPELKAIPVPASDIYSELIEDRDALLVETNALKKDKLMFQSQLDRINISLAQLEAEKELLISKINNVDSLIIPNCDKLQNLQDRLLCSLELKSGKEISVQVLMGHQLPVNCLDFNKRLVCSGHHDTTIKIWDLASAHCLHTLIGHSGPVNDIQMNDKILVSGSDDGTVKIWHLDDPSYASNTLIGHSSGVSCLQFDSTRILTGSFDKSICVWDTSSGELLNTFSADSQAEVVNSQYGKEFDAWSTVGYHSTSHGYVSSLFFQDFALASGHALGSIRLWDLRCCQYQREIRPHLSTVNGIAFDNYYMFSGSQDGDFKSIDLRMFQEVERFKFNSAVESICLSQGKVSLATSNDVHLYNRSTGLLRPLGTDVQRIKSVKHRNGLIVVGGEGLNFWEI